ncbi:MAG: hypothetical protein HY716_09060 [Planctomycetes bacterium]|nr:hypothetical protein [Planctomycetota bacterium]
MKVPRSPIAAGALILWVVAAPSAPAPANRSLLQEEMAVAETGAVVGTIRFEGDPPKRRKVRVDEDPDCGDMHPKNDVLSEDVVVGQGDDGSVTLANVFVYVKKGLTRTYEPPKDPALLDQVG